LKSVTSPPVTGTPNGNDFPAGKTTAYTYSSGYTNELENHLLLSVMDASGQAVRQFVYQHNESSLDFLRCLSVQRGTNTPTMISYLPQTPSPTNQFAVMRCVMNDPEGNVTELFYDARNRCVTERDFTGRAIPGQPVTDVANRPTGKLRAGDPDDYETRWAWNEDSLCTSVIWPGGNSESMIYQRAFNQNSSRSNHTHASLHDADLRVIHEYTADGQAVDLDGDGVADTAERVWRFEYDPRFGSEPAARKDMYDWIRGYTGLVPAGNGVAINQKGTGADKGRIAGKDMGKPVGEWIQAVRSRNDPRRTMSELNSSSLTSFRGWDGTIKGVSPADYTYPELHSHGHDTCAENAFTVSVTDPRGNVTTASYDGAGNCVHVARPEADAADFTYNAHGQLTAVTNAPDANGQRRVDTFSYYASGPSAGYLQSIAIDEPGMHLTTSFETDARGNVTRYVDPLGHDWLNTYNALDQCVRCQTPTNLVARCATDYFYDENDNLVETATEVRDATDKLQGSTLLVRGYDRLHRLRRSMVAVDATHSRTNDFVYNGNDQCVEALGGDAVSGADPFQTMSYEYDERGLLFREIAAAGSAIAATNEYDYDANGHTARVNKIDSFTIKQTVISRDGFDRLASLTDPMGNQTVCFYDANDNLKDVRQYGETNDVPGSAGNIRLAETRYDYDALDRRVRTHELYFNPATQAPVGNGECATAFGFAPNGECFSRTNDLGQVTTFGYDTAGRLNLVTSPETRTSFAILLNGNSCGTNCIETDLSDLGGNPQVFSRSYAYDSLNRCISTADNVGNTTTYSYDSLDRCVQTVDPRGVHTFYAYDLLGRCIQSIGDLDGDGVPDLADDIMQSSTWSSSSDRLLAQTDTHTNTTSYSYDSLGRCTLITRADGTQCSLVWSPRSNLIRLTDANGSVITNAYDLDNRLVHRDITAQTTAGVADTTTFETFEFDGCSRLVGHHDDDCDGYLAYDSLGNCRRETLNGLSTTSTYAPLGNRLSLAGPSGRTLSYSYDALERCSAISESGKELAGYAYDGPERVARMDLNNGMVTRIFYNGMAGAANAPGDYGWGEIRRVAHAVNGAGVVSDCTFAYDPNQNQTLRSVLIPGSSPRTNVMALAYDNADRLRESLVTDNAAPARDTVYGLDRMGNRTNVVGAACAGDYTLDGTALGPLDFQMNQYTATPCDSRIYDNNGNLVERDTAAGPVTYQYDYANRLVLVQAFDSGIGALAPVASYSYDALGRRIYKIVYAGTTTNVTQFAYDGGDVIEEWSNGSVSISYVRDASDVPAGGVLSLRRNGKDFYLHADDQGNTVALTDANGAVVERYEYDDYGAVMFLAPDGTVMTGGDGLPVTASPAGNAYGWKGIRLDAETGLENDDSAGYFEPSSGRSLARDGNNDPGSMPGGGNNTGGNNPWSMAAAKISDFGMSRLSSAGLIHRDIAARNVLSGKFENGDVPNQDDFSRISGGMMHLHHEGVVHRDLAARNILSSHFETGDKPTQEQFASVIDSRLNRADARDLSGQRSSEGGLCGETSHFIVAHEIGSGAFGRVSKGSWRNTATAASPAGKTVEKFHVRQEFGPSQPVKR
jgi:YD repeat-containing protein